MYEKEVTEINNLRVEVAGIYTQLGRISIEKRKRLDEFEDAELKLQNRHVELIAVEQKLFTDLNKKYGDGDYNPETGVFTPAIEPNSPTEETK